MSYLEEMYLCIHGTMLCIASYWSHSLTHYVLTWSKISTNVVKYTVKMKFTVIITNNTKYSIYVYICLFLRKFYSETNKSKQSWMLIQIQMYVRCGNRGHTVSTTIHGGNIFFPHHCWVWTKFCIAKHFNLYNSWNTAINSPCFDCMYMHCQAQDEQCYTIILQNQISC